MTPSSNYQKKINMSKYLIVIVGPTAVGKTSTAIEVAQHYNTCIFSADSRQFYKEMSIGTAKPTPSELAQAQHFFVDSHSIQHPINVGDFEQLVLQQLEEEFQKYDTIILTGGSGLYVDAICNGIDDIPKATEELRNELNTWSLEKLQKEVQEKDPEYYSIVDQQNPHRLVRALEVCLTTGKPYSSFRTKQKVERPFNIVKIGLEREREELYHRINTRMDIMLREGLKEEAKLLYPYKELAALKTVGYQEIYRFMDGEYDWNEAVRLLKRNSRRYAKRQMTWFKKDENTSWFHPTDLSQIIAHIEKEIKK